MVVGRGELFGKAHYMGYLEGEFLSEVLLSNSTMTLELKFIYLNKGIQSIDNYVAEFCRLRRFVPLLIA